MGRGIGDRLLQQQRFRGVIAQFARQLRQQRALRCAEARAQSWQCGQRLPQLHQIARSRGTQADTRQDALQVADGTKLLRHLGMTLADDEFGHGRIALA